MNGLCIVSYLLKFKWFQILLETQSSNILQMLVGYHFSEENLLTSYLPTSLFSLSSNILKCFASDIIISHHIFDSDPYLIIHVSSSNLFDLCFESKHIIRVFFFFLFNCFNIANHPRFPGTSGTKFFIGSQYYLFVYFISNIYFFS